LSRHVDIVTVLGGLQVPDMEVENLLFYRKRNSSPTRRFRNNAAHLQCMPAAVPAGSPEKLLKFLTGIRPMKIQLSGVGRTPLKPIQDMT
jgi:hypothetical protein